MTNPLKVRFVLVRPRNPNNIGAAARALANFGFTGLSVVDPFEPVWKETRSALAGEGLLRKTKPQTLAQAVRGAHLVLGTADGRRKDRRPVVPLPGLSDYLETALPTGGRIAILFGSEKTGLTNRELQTCKALLRIPTKAQAPSMNLGQAVALVAAELARPGLPTKVKEAAAAMPTAEQLEDLLGKTLSALNRLEYALATPDEVKAARLRSMFALWRLSRRDAAFLQAVFGRINLLPKC